MDVTLLYFESCPNWQEAHARVQQALREVGAPGVALSVQCVDTDEQAQQLLFRGSPTVLVDGKDPFADPSAPVGLACRLYQTPAGPAGVPSLEELTAVLRATA